MPVLDPAGDMSRLVEFWTQDPVLNSVPLGLFAETPDGDARADWFVAVVERNGSIVAAAHRTGTFPKMGLSGHGDEGAMQELAGLAFAAMPDLPSVMGRRGLVEPFCAAWSRLSGRPVTPSMQERIHRLVAVRPQPAVPGRMRRAELPDRELLVAWMQGFAADTGIIETRIPGWAGTEIGLRLGRGSLFLWEDGEPVSMAGRRATGNGVARIGPVYTPPTARRRGYAGALVAQLSQRMLDEGCHTCCLFTDVRNPTSNHVYAKVGYEPIADVEDVLLNPG
jgi:GNAT superfamily N-acetyltransferase